MKNLVNNPIKFAFDEMKKAYTANIGRVLVKSSWMSAVEQLDWVYNYYKPFRGRLNSLSDCYLAVLYPVAVGQSENYVLFKAPSIAYTQNSGLDTETPKKGYVTKKDAAAQVERMMLKGESNSKW